MTEQQPGENSNSELVSFRHFPLFKILLCWLVFICVAACLNLFQVFLNSLYSEPMLITAIGLDRAKKSDINVTLTYMVGKGATDVETEFPAFQATSQLQWTWSSFWIKRIRLHLTKDALRDITSLVLKVGSVSNTFSGSDIRGWKRDDPLLWALPNAPADSVVTLTVPAAKSSIAINMPEPTSLLAHAALPGAVLATSFAISLLLTFRFRSKLTAKLRKVLGDESGGAKPNLPEARLQVHLFTVIGFAAVIAGFVILNASEQYPFLQDDNYCQFLPVVMRSAETLAQGRLPLWNPYQLFGAPTLSVGTYALTYPPTYLSYYLALLVGNKLATFEIFCTGHLTLGYFIAVWALRRFGVSASLAAAGGVCWALCGWFLVCGRSQANFTPYALFLPLLIDSFNTLFTRGANLRWTIWTGALIGILFHAGHAELWMYTVLIFSTAGAVMLLTKNLDRRNMLYSLSALLGGISLAAPLLVLQKLETANIARQGGTAWPVDILPILFPLGAWGYTGYSVGSVNYKFGSEMNYGGTIFTAVALATAAIWLATSIFNRKIFNRTTVKNNIWLLAGVLAFILCLGAPGILWSLLSYMPVFEKFRWSVKYLPFMHVFFIFSGAMILQRCVNARVQNAVFLAAVALMLFHVTLCRSTIYTFLDNRYPPIANDAIPYVTGDKRIFTAVPFRVPRADAVQSFGLNFATAYTLISATGYDTFVTSKPEYERFLSSLYRDSMTTMKAYGISTLIVNDCLEHPISTGNPAEQTIEVVSERLQKPVYEMKKVATLVANALGRRIYALPKPDSMAFVKGKPDFALPYKIDQAGVYIDVQRAEGGQTVVSNFTRWPWIYASVDGKAVQVGADEWDRIEVKLAAAGKKLFIEYKPPWELSLSVAACFLVASLALAIVAGRRNIHGR
jgi:hypothetical protein